MKTIDGEQGKDGMSISTARGDNEVEEGGE
jgi:hypothetical protein